MWKPCCSLAVSLIVLQLQCDSCFVNKFKVILYDSVDIFCQELAGDRPAKAVKGMYHFPPFEPVLGAEKLSHPEAQ